jgi:hypothetical protein
MDDKPVEELVETSSSESTASGTSASETSASETLLLAAVTGTELLNFLKALVPGRTGKSQGYSYNRVVKVMNTLNLLPANFTTVSYGLMKGNQKIQLNTVIGALSQEINGKEIFDKLKDAALNRTEVVSAVNEIDNEGGVLVNRWALMIEFYVHPSARDELTNYFTKLSSDERPGVLTDGIKNHKKTAVTELLRICMEEVAPNVRNCFVSDWPSLSSIHPENGTFPSHDIFLSLLSEVRSSWDILRSNLTKSGTQESGIVLDSTAFDFCKYGQRTCKLHHFYMWLKWNKEDVLFLSNSLSEGVAADGNLMTPYTRRTPGDNGTTKLSAGERKANKASHTEKMIGSIGKCVADAFQTIPSQSTVDPGQLSRTAAYIKKEEEVTLSITLKRLRETIEAPSFSNFSPNTQTRVKNKYQAEVVRTLFD